MPLKNEITLDKIIFFDGICHLCNGFVDEVISRDHDHVLKFAPLQGETAAKILPKNETENLDSVVYFKDGKLFKQSSAIIEIFYDLGGAYKILIIIKIIPAFIRDFIYSIIAKNRYAWFGQRDFCRLPKPEERQYLLP